MIKAKLYNQDGQEQGEIKLNPKIFEVAINNELVHQAVRTLLANRRLTLAHTKDRGEVRGGGRKPWRQKGTGRARHGSIRSPLWRGGGVTFGPRKERNFFLKINKKMRRKALLMALSDRAKEKMIKVLGALELSEAKTKTMRELTKKLDIKKSWLLVIEKMDKNIVRASRNLPKMEIISASSLNVYDILRFNNIIFTKKALKILENVFLKKEETPR